MFRKYFYLINSKVYVFIITSILLSCEKKECDLIADFDCEAKNKAIISKWDYVAQILYFKNDTLTYQRSDDGIINIINDTLKRINRYNDTEDYLWKYNCNRDSIRLINLGPMISRKNANCKVTRYDRERIEFEGYFSDISNPDSTIRNTSYEKITLFKF